MKKLLIFIILILISRDFWGQRLLSGEYDLGMKIAFDETTNKLTGYFENYTGWDEQTNLPMFSCIFYLEGIAKSDIVKISTYYPEYKEDDIIEGTVEIINNKTIRVKLSEEHGGCWNVQSFADESIEFELKNNISCIQIRYVNVVKTYFYSEKSIDKKQKAYLIKNDFVYVEKIDKDWAYCTFYGKKQTKGWLKVSDLNTL